MDKDIKLNIVEFIPKFDLTSLLLPVLNFRDEISLINILEVLSYRVVCGE